MTDRQTDRQVTDRQIDKQTNKKTDWLDGWLTADHVIDVVWLSLTDWLTSQLSDCLTVQTLSENDCIPVGGGGGTPLFGLYRDVLLDRVWFFGLSILNRVYYSTRLYLNRYIIMSREILTQTASSLFLILVCDPEPARSRKSMRSSGRQVTQFFSCMICIIYQLSKLTYGTSTVVSLSWIMRWKKDVTVSSHRHEGSRWYIPGGYSL